MAVFNGTAGIDTFVGTDNVVDTFNFTVANLAGTDTLTGGNGATVDVLNFTTAGTVTSAQMANVTGIETITFALGTNSITLTNAQGNTAAGNGTITVVGNTGSDTVDATADASGVILQANSGTDTLLGGHGPDIFQITPANLTSADTFSAGNFANLDTLELTAAGTLAASAFSNITGVERLILANGLNNITLSDAMVGSSASQVLEVDTNDGEDNISGAALTAPNRVLFSIAGGEDTLTGGAGDDTFNYIAPNAFDINDSLTGGAGTDTLSFDNAGTIAQSAFSNVSQIEQLVLANGTNSVTLSNAMVGSATGFGLTVTGGTGNDTVDATTLSGFNHVINNSGSGDDTLTGGSGADTFRFAPTDYNGNDVINGNAGQDTLEFTTAATVAAAAFTQTTGVENIQLANGTNNITLLNAMVGTATSKTVTVTGGSGNDTVDGSGVNFSDNSLILIAGSGDDHLIGGNGLDQFRFLVSELSSLDVVQGDATDTLTFLDAGTVGAPAFANVSGIKTILLANGANNITLADALATTANANQLVVSGGSGNDTVDGSSLVTGFNSMIAIAGSGNDHFIGGAYRDIFRFAVADFSGADIVAGGGELDTLEFTTAGTLLAAQFTGVSQVERVQLANGTNNLTVSDAMVSSLTGNNLQIEELFGGNDTINASTLTGANHVTITATGGTDSLTGGAGNDVFNLDMSDVATADTIVGGAGTDELDFSFTLTVAASYFANVSGVEVIRLDNGMNDVTLNDAMVGSADGATVTIFGGSNADDIDGNALTGNHRMIAFANAGVDSFVGGAGNDIVHFDVVNFNNDLFNGGDGLDTLQFDTAGTRTAAAFASIADIENIQLADGTNSIALPDSAVNFAAGHILTVTGGTGSDTVDGSAAIAGHMLIELGNGGVDNLTGGAGNDQLDGGTGGDTMTGGAGNDFFFVDNVLDVVHEATSGGSDRVFASLSYTLGAGEEIEKLSTTSNNGTGAISFTGNELANIIFGNAGANTLDGKAGADDLTGLAGDDFYYVDTALDKVNEAAGGGTDRVFASVSYALKTGQEIEKLTTDNNVGTSAINLTGNELANIVFGNNGANTLDGKGGVDSLNGLSGDDFYIVDNPLDVVNEAVGDGNDRVFASVSYTLKAGQTIEKLTTASNDGTDAIDLSGNELADLIYGNAGANNLDGKGGVDDLNGLGGDDLYYVDNALDETNEASGDGSDRVFASVSYTLKAGQSIEKLTTDNNAGTGAINLTGNELADTIFGNNGANLLNGGGGNDTLVGLGGADTFVFSTALNAATNHDTISDLAIAADRVQLAKSVFALLTGSAGATLAAGEFVSGAGLTNAQDANDRIVYNTTTGDLYYDTNGTTAGATLFATLANHAGVNNANFVLG